MGIPGFTKWLKTNFPTAFLSLSHVENISFDEIFVDINSLLHSMSRTCNKEVQLLSRVRGHIMGVLRDPMNLNTQSFFFTLDGPAALSKLSEQRKRRSSNAQIAHLKGRFNAQQFTPGCSFMVRLESQLEKLLSSFFKTSSIKPNSIKFDKKAVISGASDPGEGEIKVFHEINRRLMDVNVRANVRAVYSRDSDTFVLALCSMPRIISQFENDSVNPKFISSNLGENFSKTILPKISKFPHHSLEDVESYKNLGNFHIQNNNQKIKKHIQSYRASSSLYIVSPTWDLGSPEHAIFSLELMCEALKKCCSKRSLQQLRLDLSLLAIFSGNDYAPALQHVSIQTLWSAYLNDPEYPCLVSLSDEKISFSCLAAFAKRCIDKKIISPSVLHSLSLRRLTIDPDQRCSRVISYLRTTNRILSQLLGKVCPGLLLTTEICAPSFDDFCNVDVSMVESSLLSKDSGSMSEVLSIESSKFKKSLNESSVGGYNNNVESNKIIVINMDVNRSESDQILPIDTGHKGELGITTSSFSNCLDRELRDQMLAGPKIFSINNKSSKIETSLAQPSLKIEKNDSTIIPIAQSLTKLEFKKSLNKIDSILPGAAAILMLDHSDPDSSSFLPLALRPLAEVYKFKKFESLEEEVGWIHEQISLINSMTVEDKLAIFSRGPRIIKVRPIESIQNHTRTRSVHSKERLFCS